MHRYAAGKWTIKETLVHISDDERIYAYRALRFARNDSTELPGFEQDDFARASNANARDLNDILDELATVRNATISLFNSFDEEALLRKGRADGKIMSVRAAAYHIAGHELHHMNIIKARYL
ncbi:MAG: DinB family protein [candidate division KSB1 bacterium]